MNFNLDTVHEEDLSAPPTETSKHPRVPHPHGDKERAQSAQPPPQGGPQTADSQRSPVSRRGRGEEFTVRQSLRRSNILRGYRSFTTIISQGTLIVARPVRMYYLLEPSPEPDVQIGFAVARGVRNAVVRNRIKRVMREAVRLHLASLAEDIHRRQHRLRAVLLFTPQGPARALRATVPLATVEAPVADLLSRIDHALTKLP